MQKPPASRWGASLKRRLFGSRAAPPAGGARPGAEPLFTPVCLCQHAGPCQKGELGFIWPVSCDSGPNYQFLDQGRAAVPLACPSAEAADQLSTILAWIFPFILLSHSWKHFWLMRRAVKQPGSGFLPVLHAFGSMQAWRGCASAGCLIRTLKSRLCLCCRCYTDAVNFLLYWFSLTIHLILWFTPKYLCKVSPGTFQGLVLHAVKCLL